jgi:DNA modification methylase
VTVTLCQGDALDLARSLPPGSIDAVVTSPPYFKMREYSSDPRQLGARDQSLGEYVDYLVALFGALLPALEPHAAVWLNLGARFAAGGFGIHGPALRRRPSWDSVTGRRNRQTPPVGYHERDLLPLPALVADALRSRVPLICRAEIVWSKPVAVESPRIDRPSRSHEMLYLFAPKHPCRARDPGEKWWKTSVWSIPVESAARTGHPAAMPLELAQRCIRSSGNPRLVLDPFCGSGTTLLASTRLGVDAVGFDLEPGYLEKARHRLVTDSPLFAPEIVTDSDVAGGRVCPVDGVPLLGRADQVTCSDRCRQRAYRKQSG